jgi:uncharacterized membrane protein
MTFLNFVSRYMDALPEEMREQFIEDIEELIAFSIRQAFAATNSRRA